jgi:hypothetical protein
MTSSSTTTDQSPASKDLEIAEELENSFPVPPIQPIQIPNRLVQKERRSSPTVPTARNAVCTINFIKDFEFWPSIIHNV